MTCKGTTTIEPNEIPITVKNVLHVPKLAVNLLSVSQIVENGNSVIFNKNGCTIKNADDQVIAKCAQTGGVYRLQGEKKCLLAQNDKGAMYWHRRLGHAHIQLLQRMKKEKKYGIDFDDNSESQIKNCEICAKGKHARKQFEKSGTTTGKVLELVHSDLAGPMENASYGGAKYMLVFVDDFSRMVFVYFLKKKSDTFEKFVEFKNMKTKWERK